MTYTLGGPLGHGLVFGNLAGSGSVQLYNADEYFHLQIRHSRHLKPRSSSSEPLPLVKVTHPRARCPVGREGSALVFITVEAITGIESASSTFQNESNPYDVVQIEYDSNRLAHIILIKTAIRVLKESRNRVAFWLRRD